MMYFLENCECIGMNIEYYNNILILEFDWNDIEILLLCGKIVRFFELVF